MPLKQNLNIMSITERIIEVSAKMFAQQGVKAIRMDDIASQLGISKRTLYEQFKDKDTLIEQSLIRHFAIIEEQERIKTAGAHNVIEEFILLIDDLEGTMQHNFNLMDGVKKFYPAVYEKLIVERNKIGYDRFKLRVREGVEQGLFLSGINIDLAVSVFADSIFGVISRADQYLPNNISISDAFKYIITYFFRGISTDKGIKILDNYLNKINK